MYSWKLKRFLHDLAGIGMIEASVGVSNKKPRTFEFFKRYSHGTSTVRWRELKTLQESLTWAEDKYIAGSQSIVDEELYDGSNVTTF